jgi:hypothetical protein
MLNIETIRLNGAIRMQPNGESCGSEIARLVDCRRRRLCVRVHVHVRGRFLSASFSPHAEQEGRRQEP